MRAAAAMAMLALALGAGGCGGGGGGGTSSPSSPVITELTVSPTSALPLAGFTVTARVADPQGPADVAGATLKLPWEADPQPMTAGADSFTFSGVVPSNTRPGTSRLLVTAWDQARHTVTGTANLQVLGIWVSGVVTKAEDQSPVADAVVQLAGTALQATTSSSGDFGINVPPGTVGYLHVEAPGYLPANSDRLTLTSNVVRGLVLLTAQELAQLYEAFEVTQQPGAGTLFVNPTDAAGEHTVTGCSLSVQPPPGAGFATGVSERQYLWGFNLAPLGANTYAVTVTGPGGTWPSAACPIAAGEVTEVVPLKRLP